MNCDELPCRMSRCGGLRYMLMRIVPPCFGWAPAAALPDAGAAVWVPALFGPGAFVVLAVLLLLLLPQAAVTANPAPASADVPNALRREILVCRNSVQCPLPIAF